VSSNLTASAGIKVMKNTEKAFLWITDILEQKGIKYKISGGFAARIYGVDRELADIDIEMENTGIPLIEETVNPYIISGPERYKDDNWDLEVMTLVYEGQEIDIAGIEAKIFNVQTKQWEELKNDLNDNTIMEIYGKKVPIESISNLIAYKTKLSREVDIKDVRQLKQINRI
jgi:hypothetical protein